MLSRRLFALLVAVGCGIEDEPDYVASRADAECGRMEACALGYFESEYADQEDCVDERADDLDELHDSLDEAQCEFEPDEAGPCVGRIRGMSCEDWSESDADRACDLVWTCTRDIGYTTYEEYRSP